MSRLTDPVGVIRAVTVGVGRLQAAELEGSEREAHLDAQVKLYARKMDIQHPFAREGRAADGGSRGDRLGQDRQFRPGNECSTRKTRAGLAIFGRLSGRAGAGTEAESVSDLRGCG